MRPLPLVLLSGLETLVDEIVHAGRLILLVRLVVLKAWCPLGLTPRGRWLRLIRFLKQPGALLGCGRSPLRINPLAPFPGKRPIHAVALPGTRPLLLTTCLCVVRCG
jgi:hypothetical protein